MILTLDIFEHFLKVAHLLMMENNCIKSYQNASVNVGVMLRTKPTEISADGRRMDNDLLEKDG